MLFLDNIQEERAWENQTYMDNIIMDLQTTMWKDMEWIYLMQDRDQCWAL